MWGGRGGLLAAKLAGSGSTGALVYWVLCFGDWTHVRCFSSTPELTGVAVTHSPHAVAVLTSDVAGGVLLRLSWSPGLACMTNTVGGQLSLPFLLAKRMQRDSLSKPKWLSCLLRMDVKLESLTS